MTRASVHSWSQFYHHLAYLFYAVTDADDRIHDEEVKMLHSMVVQDWLELERSSDEFGTDSAFQIEAFFDLIREKEIHTDAAFRKFEEYYHDNPRFFDADVINRIYHTCQKISTAFGHTNKKERAMIQRVHLLLGPV